MFCPECGNRVEEGELFCPECGTKIENTVLFGDDNNSNNTPINTGNASPVVVRDDSEHKRNKLKNIMTVLTPVAIIGGKRLLGSMSEVLGDIILNCCKSDGSPSNREIIPGGCIIFTNINQLSKKFKVESSLLNELFKQFIDIKKKAGITYHLADVSNYTYKCKKGFLGISKKVSLDSKSELGEYLDILADIIESKKAENETPPTYLFIIGGHDTIPMPRIKNYEPYKDINKTVDTDILYAYPYGSEMIPLLESKELFRYEQAFHIGRLPFGNNSNYNSLFNYLQRDINCTYGIEISQSYAQCDPNWKNVSTRVSKESKAGGFLRNLDGQLSDEYYYNRMILSPMVHIENVQQIFDKKASLYYYNLHGGYTEKFYYGAIKGTKNATPVLSPGEMKSCENPNIVASEACYGARFIGLNEEESMLLSSIHSQTMNFLGSSRLSWGCGDGDITSPQQAGVMNADIMAYAFMRALLEKHTVGEAMFIARRSVFSNQNPADPKTALTIVEFNLFGDPTLFLVPQRENATNKSINIVQTDEEPLCSKETPLATHIEEIENNDKQDTPVSILQQVRNAVNANIAQMHDIIGKHLYKAYGIEPRPADSIFKIKYANGNEEYNFKYEVSDKNAQIPQYISVTTTSAGNIKEINTSK